MIGKPRKISVLLSETDFQQLDRLCHLKGYKKSTLVARLIHDFLAENNAQIDDKESSDLKGEQ